MQCKKLPWPSSLPGEYNAYIVVNSEHVIIPRTENTIKCLSTPSHGCADSWLIRPKTSIRSSMNSIEKNSIDSRRFPTRSSEITLPRMLIFWASGNRRQAKRPVQVLRWSHMLQTSSGSMKIKTLYSNISLCEEYCTCACTNLSQNLIIPLLVLLQSSFLRGKRQACCSEMKQISSSDLLQMKLNFRQ